MKEEKLKVEEGIIDSTYQDLIWQAPRTGNRENVTDALTFLEKLIHFGHIVSRSALAAHFSVGEAALKELFSTEFLEWFDSFARYVNLDRVALGFLKSQGVVSLLVNEFDGFVTTRSGERPETGMIERKILEYKIINEDVKNDSSRKDEDNK